MIKVEESSIKLLPVIKNLLALRRYTLIYLFQEKTS